MSGLNSSIANSAALSWLLLYHKYHCNTTGNKIRSGCYHCNTNTLPAITSTTPCPATTVTSPRPTSPHRKFYNRYGECGITMPSRYLVSRQNCRKTAGHRCLGSVLATRIKPNDQTPPEAHPCNSMLATFVPPTSWRKNRPVG